MTSVMILMVFSIPSAMFLSILILKLRYHRLHFIAVGLSFLAIAITLISDLVHDSEAVRFDKKSIYGDLLCLAGAFCIALSNVLQEWCLSADLKFKEFLGYIGLCGFIISSL